MTVYKDGLMNYDLVLTNTALTRIAEYILWLCRIGGAIHVGTNRNKTALMIKLFGVATQPVTFWINSDQDVDTVLKEIYDTIALRIGSKPLVQATMSLNGGM